MADEKLFVTETIEDVNKSMWRYIWQRTLVLISILIVPVGLIVYWLFYRNNGNLAFLIVIPIIIVAYIRNKIIKAFIEQFASANGFTYAPSGDLEGLDGQLFQVGESKSVSNVVSGTHQNFPLRFFYYSYAEGHGKDRHVYEFTVCEIEYQRALPHILMEKESFLGSALSSRGGMEKLKFANDFDAHFSVYVNRGYEIEALEIFTPEVLEALLARANNFEFEFVGQHLFIYTKGYITTRKRLEELHELGDYLISTLSPRLFGINRSVKAMQEAESGQTGA
jgi:hypothetical protein